MAKWGVEGLQNSFPRLNNCLLVKGKGKKNLIYNCMHCCTIFEYEQQAWSKFRSHTCLSLCGAQTQNSTPHSALESAKCNQAREIFNFRQTTLLDIRNIGTMYSNLLNYCVYILVLLAPLSVAFISSSSSEDDRALPTLKHGLSVMVVCCSHCCCCYRCCCCHRWCWCFPISYVGNYGSRFWSQPRLWLQTPCSFQ